MENQDVTQESWFTDEKTKRSLVFVTKVLLWAQVIVSLVFAANAYIRFLDVFAKPSSLLVAVAIALLSFQVALLCLLFPVLVLDLIPSISAQFTLLKTRFGRVFFLFFISALFIADDKHGSSPISLSLVGLVLSLLDILMVFWIVPSASSQMLNQTEQSLKQDENLFLDASSSSSIQIERLSTKDTTSVSEKISQNGLPLFAVLIDADNIAPKHTEAILRHVSTFGVPALRRVYGDWSRSNLTSWLQTARVLGFDTRQQNANICSKNASDISIVVEAMDLLYTRNFDGFAIVSSDSDFTQLVLRLREDGKLVLGFGEAHTSEVLKSACNLFLCVKELDKSPNCMRNIPNLVRQDTSTGARSSSSIHAPVIEPSLPKSPKASFSGASGRNGKPFEKAIRLVSTAMHRIDPKAEWYELGVVGTMIIRLDPKFNLKEYGVTKLSDLIKKTPGYELKTVKNSVRIRRRQEVGHTEEAGSIIRKAVELIKPCQEWYKLGEVGVQIRRVNADFNLSKYGAKKLIDIVKDMAEFEIRIVGGLPEIRLVEMYPALSEISTTSKR